MIATFYATAWDFPVTVSVILVVKTTLYVPATGVLVGETVYWYPVDTELPTMNEGKEPEGLKED